MDQKREEPRLKKCVRFSEDPPKVVIFPKEDGTFANQTAYPPPSEDDHWMSTYMWSKATEKQRRIDEERVQSASAKKASEEPDPPPLPPRPQPGPTDKVKSSLIWLGEKLLGEARRR
jgi:hypothetical protein